MTNLTIEWEELSSGVYALRTPSDAQLYCSTGTVAGEHARLYFGAYVDSPLATGWYVNEQDLDVLIAALQDIRQKVFK